jgi:hypothetical protein
MNYFLKHIILIKYKYLFLLFGFMFLQKETLSQIKIVDTLYKTFDGRSINVYLIEGGFVVLNIDKNEITNAQLKDTLVLKKIINRGDSLYSFYKTNLGYEPPGGNSNYNFKANLFFGPPSCGSGCGLVGAKGIEVSGFANIFYNLKYNLNVNRDVIIGYELGRNFFTFSNKILFPYDLSKNERNGGFAEGFANIFYTYAFNQILKEPNERIFNETLLNPEWARMKFIGYINDTLATPYNTISKADLIGVRDPNRGFDGWNFGTISYDGYSILEGIISTIGKDKLFPNFFKELLKLPDVITKEDAMSNIAIAASKATNYNLNSFFKNVIKFNLNKDAVELIDKLPAYPSKLIKYEDQLWFITPNHKIRLNLRSTNYIGDNYNYKIFLNDTLISNSKNGNNEIEYSILKNRNEVKILCQLTDNNNNIVDTFSTKLSKRHNIDLLKYPNKWYAYYLSNKNTTSYLDSTGNYVLKNLDDTSVDEGLLFYNFIIPKNRILSFKSDVKNFSKYVPGVVSNYSGVGYFSPGRYAGGDARIGYDIGQNDSTKFYTINGRDSTQLYMYDKDLFMLRIGMSNYGRGVKSYFKNLIIRDENDSDADGIVDFEDQCNFGENSVKPNFNTTNYNFCIGDTLKLTVNNLKQNEKLIWYYGGKVDSTNKLSLNVTDSMKIFVLKKDSIGCSRYSDTIQIKKFQIPSTPTLSRDTASYLVSNTNIGNTWYKDGTALTDTTKKIKPTVPGSYTVKTTQNGCVSSLSAPYYYLVTDIINLSKDEFIKLAPNPFINQLNFDFVVKGYQRLNLEVFDIATGSKVANQQNITAGTQIQLGQLARGTYIIRITSNDNKIAHQFKMVKL